MNRIKFPRDKRKAAIVVCLFLWTDFLNSGFARIPDTDKQWTFDAQTQKAYDQVLNLELEAAHLSIPSPETSQEHYVIGLAEALELLITEDGEKYVEYEDHFNQRLERKTKTNIPDDLFLQAEIRMHWAFVYLKFGHEFDAALNLRQSYLTIKSIQEKFPHYHAVKKTSGLLEVVIGSVPQKYSWVLALLNMDGTTQAGIKQLEAIRDTRNPFAYEAEMFLSLIEGFLLQRPDEGVRGIQKMLKANPKNRLALFLGGALYKKNGQGEEALFMLDNLGKLEGGLPIHLADYLKGEVYLCKGDYLSAISSYRVFLSNYRGVNGIKDAHYKIGLCHWLNGNVNDAHSTFKLARSVGKEASEADKYAARSLAEDELPHIVLTKARYATDGGYYEKATTLLDSLTEDDLATVRDRVEHQYRLARLAHKTGDVDSAKKFYLQTITVNGDEPWYFAPNACLQLGYLFLDENDVTSARNYFNKALSYSRHEYKNSIDSKAKSAIAQIRRK